MLDLMKVPLAKTVHKDKDAQDVVFQFNDRSSSCSVVFVLSVAGL